MMKQNYKIELETKYKSNNFKNRLCANNHSSGSFFTLKGCDASII